MSEKLRSATDDKIPLRGPASGLNFGLIAALAAFIAIMLLPTPEGLPIAGQRMLAIFIFAVIIWITEAIDFAVSAIVIAAMMAVALGLSPDVSNTDTLLGTSKALGTAITGFSSRALILVAAALLLSAAMTLTGLDRRIAMIVLSKVGASVSHIVIGSIVVATLLAFLVPSATARAAAVIPIMMGIVATFGAGKQSRFAGLLIMTTVQAVSIWNVGIKTAAAQNMVAVGFLQRTLGLDITWLDWFVAAAPFSLLMSAALYFVMMRMMPPEHETVPGGRESVAAALKEIGPMTGAEKRLLSVSLLLVFCWATEGVLHHFDSATLTVLAVTFLLLPGVGVMSWKQANAKFPWGTIVLFGVGISLGSALLSTGAASWLAKSAVDMFGLSGFGTLGIVAVLGGFLIVIHLGFASATALASSMIPIIIAVLQQMDSGSVNVFGTTILLQFVVSFGFILPVNSPQGMVAHGTDTFAVKDFVRTGLVLTVIAYMLTLVFTATYWKWLGLA
ncbi:DASS family sodium-coupled anion symporter [Thalassospira profundimaris]|uniref:DASS family sodium-coupled anion symporter n=1 Tax=Thalassospira profundimaris TaxID=502049 RepID=UPI000DED3A33|nr:DASS family sodium-coupled anion symporter [Thalassospira profundimaris]